LVKLPTTSLLKNVYDQLHRHSWYLRYYRKGIYTIVWWKQWEINCRVQNRQKNNDYVVNIILNFISRPKEFLFESMISVCGMWCALINIYKDNN
jgi:hypothetical protein